MSSRTGVMYLERGFRLKEKEKFTGWTVAKPEIACPSQILDPVAFMRLRRMSSGNRGEAIFRDDSDHETFLATLGLARGRTGWLIHAYDLMENHNHLIS